MAFWVPLVAALLGGAAAGATGALLGGRPKQPSVFHPLGQTKISSGGYPPPLATGSEQSSFTAPSQPITTPGLAALTQAGQGANPPPPNAGVNTSGFSQLAATMVQNQPAAQTTQTNESTENLWLPLAQTALGATVSGTVQPLMQYLLGPRPQQPKQFVPIGVRPIGGIGGLYGG